MKSGASTQKKYRPQGNFQTNSQEKKNLNVNGV